MTSHRVLLFESDISWADKLQAFLSPYFPWLTVVHSVEELRAALQRQQFHLLLASANQPADLELIQNCKAERPGLAAIVLGRSADPSMIVRAMRAGASDYWVMNDALDTLATVVQEVLSRVVPTLTEDIDFPFPQFVGRHPKILEIFQLIMSVKDTDSTVLITGESGTGKEVVARAIHDLSPRKKHPWVAINCGAIPSSLLESELFGHVKGAFTGATQNRMGRFQLAGNGSLFLDEIGDLSFDLQSKILRAIQQKVFEPVGSAHSQFLGARIIAATNQDLEAAVREKRFREDLFYRLNVIPIFIPPLRARKSDIPLLVKTFVDRFSNQHGRPVTGISEEAMRVLTQYQWPGNIRELENMIERVVILKRDKGMIDLKDIPVQNFRQVTLDRYLTNISLPEEGVDLNEAVNDFENELIIQALQKTEGNKNRAASLLNLNRTTLVEKLKRKGLKIAC